MSDEFEVNDENKVVSFPQRIAEVGGVPTPNLADASTSFVGPFLPEYRVSCGGYRVPRLTATLLEDGMANLILDGRFGHVVKKDEAERWMWFLANAMAVAAGYSCFGSSSIKDPNPFKVQMVSVSSVGAAEGTQT